MAKTVPTGIVTFWNSALGHTVRDAFVSFGSTLVLVLINALANVHLTGQWAQFAFLVPALVTLIKAYFHVKDVNLPNLPTALRRSK